MLGNIFCLSGLFGAARPPISSSRPHERVGHSFRDQIFVRTQESCLQRAVSPPHRRQFRVAVSPLLNTCLYGTCFRSEHFATKMFPYGRLVHTEESSVCKVLTCGRDLREFRTQESPMGHVKESSVRTSLPLIRKSPMEELSVGKSSVCMQISLRTLTLAFVRWVSGRDIQETINQTLLSPLANGCSEASVHVSGERP